MDVRADAMTRNVSAAMQHHEALIYTGPERMRVILGIITCILLAALDQTVVLPAIPQMAATLGGGAHLSWVVSAFLLTSTASTPIYGKLSDQLGRRAILVPALVFFLLASVWCAVSTSVLSLILARAAQGLGGGALMAVSQAAVGDVVPARERGKYQAWFSGTWAFASLAGPVAGGFISQHFSWRWIFWGNLPIGGIALVLCIRGLAGLAPAGLRTRIDYAGATLMTVSVTAILLALSMGGVDFPWVSAGEGGLLALSAVALAGLIAQQRRAAAPLFPGALLAQAGFRHLLQISFYNSAAMLGAIFLLPLMLQWLYHATPDQAGLALVPFLGTTTLGAFTAGQITRHTGNSRPVMIAGLALSALAFAVLAAFPAAGSVALPVSLSAVFGLGIGFMLPTTLIAAQSQAGRQNMGTATAMLITIRAMAGAFGATAAGALLALAHPNLREGFAMGFAACAALQVAALLVALRMEEVRLASTIEAKG